MKRYKIKRKQADGSFVELSLDTSIDSVYRVKNGEIKSLTDILTEEYAPKDNPVFTGNMSLGRKEGSKVGVGSVALGSNVVSSGVYSFAEGASRANGQYSHAEGYVCSADGDYSHAEGESTIASGKHQHVQGKYNIEDTENKYAHIVGNGISSNRASNAHTLDWNGNAWYAGDVQANNIPYTISSKVLTTVSASDVKLKTNITINNLSFNTDRLYYIEFLGSKKLCSLVISEPKGPNNLSVIICDIICNIGDYTVVANSDSDLNNITIYISKSSQSGESSVTAETIPNATDLVIHEEEIKYLDSKYLESDLVLQNSISLGRVGKLAGGSTALGKIVEASGDCSHAEGDSTTASGQASHAEGGLTTASGNCSHAEGNETTASRIASHAEGSSTTASGDFSHAEGQSTTASANSSHAEGFSTTASGINSHAEGNTTTASGNNSHAEGYGTTSQGQCQHVEGKFNIIDTANKYAHIVGNGTSSSAKSNAHTLDWKGNGWYAGKLSQEGTPTEDKDLVTKKYVDDKDLTAKKYVDDKVAGIVNSAPETLDTLKELSTALGDDPNFATTVATNIGKKVDKPTTEGTEGQVLSKAADGSNVWVDNGINEDALNTMLTKTFGFVGNTAK